MHCILDPFLCESPFEDITFVKFNFGQQEEENRLKNKLRRKRLSYSSKENLNTVPFSPKEFFNRKKKSSSEEEYFPMKQVNLIRIKTETERFEEPFYEAIKVTHKSPMVGRKPDVSTSPKMMHNRKYKLTAEGKLKVKQPPLPKRNNNFFLLCRHE